MTRRARVRGSPCIVRTIVKRPWGSQRDTKNDLVINYKIVFSQQQKRNWSRSVVTDPRRASNNARFSSLAIDWHHLSLDWVKGLCRFDAQIIIRASSMSIAARCVTVPRRASSNASLYMNIGNRRNALLCLAELRWQMNWHHQFTSSSDLDGLISSIKPLGFAKLQRIDISDLTIDHRQLKVCLIVRARHSL